MVRRNDERRAALVDAAIEVLAREGARGLTFRAVDTEAGVPGGTASNYFANRDDLLTQAGARVYERYQPDEATVARTETAGRDRETYAQLMRELVERVASFRTGYLALLELRLEAVRRPELRKVLTERIRADVEANVAYHEQSGLPGDATAVRLLILTLNWLIFEQLTLPDLYPAEDRDALVTAAVDRIVGGSAGPEGA
ncbi:MULTISPECIES: TetR/AcrR family transcriptional regulator [Streptomyces]|uniref:TetR family transcriptional regulator n=1 Tax=Streptomyces tsukubensis (strain DSM 42081 / NBRC 108919 / NRRL 18488 / 9993) TaxID=1114943 RepID=I2N040_STRT9|nr:MULTISPECIES: TetR/AcrR family transcriptional regulator [Streptomyces]AZK94633.1 TetR family transcriptional regulator [Streptomyces tsukubensis]EIF90387.1 TetR family transcriptional regulator [Streptomyces tsukubensis NRRL18488]MYS65550.1 TetR family transcriptional regulator [Streptomyces sp. SID5473]QKM69283.1 TetR family transcriptional regulator [Streptomyces tsukubensis NRRL18488]TAI42785.1 TetR family transcriptional regulator [Streptomyces tsukubensis]